MQGKDGSGRMMVSWYMYIVHVKVDSRLPTCNARLSRLASLQQKKDVSHRPEAMETNASLPKQLEGRHAPGISEGQLVKGDDMLTLALLASTVRGQPNHRATKEETGSLPEACICHQCVPSFITGLHLSH